MQIALQNKIKALNINNVHFPPNHYTHKNKNTQHSTSNQALVFENTHRKTYCNITRNSFIPTTHIKSHLEFEKQKKLAVKPLNPAEMSYSRFPKRKTLSAKSSRISFPVYRQRVFSFCNYEPIDLQNSNVPDTHEKKMRSASCLNAKNLTNEKQKIIRSSMTACVSRYKLSEKGDSYNGKWQQLYRRQ